MSADVSSFLSKLAIPINKPQTLDLKQNTVDLGTPLSPPRGAITEISGPVSSGRTSLIHAILARATEAGECCAMVDGAGAFDPCSATQAGVDLMRLLWVRANGRFEAALKAADLILHSGGFGVIVLDLCEAPAAELNRIPLSYWYRFRGAVENTPGRFIVASHVPLAKSCARLPLELRREGALWIGSTPIFNGIEFAIENRKHGGAGFQPATEALASARRLAG
jgi:recA bacterial DNA recombination protein